jgi:hypothetical protein
MNNNLCKRAIINEFIQDEYIDIENDIYPCKNNDCMHYHKSIKTHVLIDAIYFLQIDKVKEILNEYEYSEIINLKVGYKNLNILEYIFSEFKGKWTKNIPSLGVFNKELKIDFNSNKNIEISYNLTMELINYLYNTYPDLITNKIKQIKSL